MPESVITLDNFSQWSGEVKGVELSSRLSLPEYVPAQQVEVRLDRIAATARMARLKRVRFGLCEENEQAVAIVEADGINSDGSATAVGVGAKATARAVIDVDKDASFGFPRGTASIQINAAHPDLNDKVLRAPDTWATLLDKGLRSGLNEAGGRQLLEPAKERAQMFVAKKMSQIAGIAAGPLLFGAAPELMIPVSMLALLEDGIGLFDRLAEEEDPERTFLAAGIPIDRYLLTRFFTVTRKLVRVSE